MYLRWYYGINREVKSAQERATEPYRNFMTNNFVIEKQIIQQIGFNETLEGYGYEDLLFAQNLKKQGISIHHIHNPLLHIGIEKTNDFIKKTANGMKNLSKMIRSNQVDDDIKIYRVYKKLDRYKLLWFIELVYVIIKNSIQKNLNSRTPKLNYFDLYKLQHLIKAMKS